MKDLFEFLSKKPLYYDEIDYTRFPRAFEAIKGFFDIPKIVHIIGTNGKGSTGRFLALMLRANGRRVGHYTSPHIFSFAERFWLDGRLASDNELQKAHEKILHFFALAKCEHFIDELSYFEWATLLACELFRGFDEIVCEAGLGGEFDATNALPKKLSIFTPIGLDHTAFLGDSLEQIATTKLNAMSDEAIISPFFACMDTAKSVAKGKNTTLIIAPKSAKMRASKIYLKGKSEFLKQNFALALCALRHLKGRWDRGVLAKTLPFDLRGRMEKIAKNITLDVGHNEHGARAICKSLSTKKVKLIYNCFADKDARAILSIFKEHISEVLVFEYKSEQRALANITDIAKDLGIKCSIFEKNMLKDKSSDFLVFGSFMLVENFILDNFWRGSYETK